MAADEIMVYTGMFIVPVVSGAAGCFLLWAVHRQALPAWASFVLFLASVPAGAILSFGFVWMNGSMLRGDGALAVVAAPVTGAILAVPVALVFVAALAVIRSRQRGSQ